MTIAEAIAARDQLEKVVASGIAESGHGDKRIKFHDPDKIQKEIDKLTAFINGVTNARPRAGAIRFRG